jgi:hypothetical protein
MMKSKVHSVTQIIVRHDHFQHPLVFFFIAKIVLTNDIITLNVLNTYVTTVYSMLLCTECQIVCFIEVGDFSASRG